MCGSEEKEDEKNTDEAKEGVGGDTAELQVEVGRWSGLKREERKCTECDSGEVEDVKHFLMRCKAWNGEREELMEKMKKVVTVLDEVEEERNVAWILDLA